MNTISAKSAAKLAKITATEPVKSLAKRGAKALTVMAINMNDIINYGYDTIGEPSKGVVARQTQVIAALLSIGARVPDEVRGVASAEAVEFFESYSDTLNVNTWIKALAAMN